MIKLDNYQLNELIYESGNTLIYRGQRNEDKLPIIAKILKKQYPTREEIQRLEQEYQLIRELAHPGIIRGLDFIDFHASKAIIMEENNSISLSKFLHDNKPELSVLLDIAVQLANIVAYIHEYGLVLRDIKPANIIINPADRQVRFIDFGLATILRHEIQDPLNLENMMGTLAYMSPEQTGRMNRTIDFRSDLYSLGITLYEIFTGGLPFRYTHPMELVHAHIAIVPVSPRKRNSSIPPILSELILRLIAKDPDERYQSARGLEDDLKSCRNALNTDGEIKPFTLGMEDFSSEFHLPERVYGRDAEIELIMQEFRRAVDGENRMLVFSGPPGIGKTRIINEVRKPLTEQAGMLISGKFEQHRHDIPYSAWIQCFEDLVRQLLAEPEDRLGDIRARILNRVGDFGQILVDIVPEIVAIIGPQKPLEELGASENSSRFTKVLCNFIKAFAVKGAPLVIYMDDLHWADSASLALIHTVLQDMSMHHMLIISSYRSEEVTDIHPVRTLFARLEDNGVDWWQECELKPLEPAAISSMVADCLRCPLEEVGELAEIIRTKTGSNPFFIREFLLGLQKNECIFFDRGWHWDINKVLATRIPDTIAELLTERINGLGGATLAALGSLACAGNNIDINFAALILKVPPETVTDILATAFNEGILIKNGGQLSFVHDRIIDAVNQHMEKGHRIHEHKRIALLMLESLPMEESDDHLFELVHQLNEALPAMDEKEIRHKTAELDIRAGRKAFRSGAYDSAETFFEIADSLIDPLQWTDNRLFMLGFITDYSETLYLTGKIAQAEAKFTILLDHAPDIMERIRIYEIMMTCYTSTYRIKEALTVGKEALALLGLRLPPYPGKIPTLLLLLKVLLATRNFSPEQIPGLPEMTDPRKMAIMRILMASTEPAYLGNSDYLGILVFQMVLCTMQNGNSPWGAYSWSGLGVIISATLGKSGLAVRFGDAALNLITAYGNQNIRCKISFLHGDMLKHWTSTLRESLPYLLDSYHTGNETGNYLWASFALNNYMFDTFFKGDDLASVNEKFGRYFLVMKKFDQPHALECYKLWFQLVRSAHTDETGIKLDGEIFKEAETIERWKNSNATSALGYYTVARLIQCYFNSNWKEGIAVAAEGRPYRKALMGQFFLVEYHFYRALNHIALAFSNRSSRISLVPAQKSLSVLTRLARTSPDVLHKAAIVRGGLKILQKKYTDATGLLDRAISGARRSGYVQDAAIASELAAHAFRVIDAETLTGTCVTEAYHNYLSWGLISKSKQLLDDYDAVIVKRDNTEKSSQTETSFPHLRSLGTLSSSGNESESLDLSSIIKSSNIMTSTIVLEDLLEKLIKVVMENAGAQRGLLLIRDENGYMVESEGTCIESLQIQLHHRHLEDYKDVPVTTITYVERTQKQLLLNRNDMTEMFRRDPYIKSHNPGSLLVQPLLHQGKMVGILYLEHLETPGAFSVKNLQMISMLSTQIAISVENAMLYRTQQTLIESYSRFVPREFITFLGKQSIVEVELGDQIQQDMSILFSDIRNFTSISEAMTPADNFNFLNAYLARVSPVVRANEGFIDKYIGDAIMALFPKHPIDAVNTAIGIQAEVRNYNASLPPNSTTRFEVGIGIHKGKLMLGTIGERERMEPTVISDAVNVASRLENLTKYYGVSIIVSDSIVEQIDDNNRIVCRFLDIVRPAGKNNAITIWEVIDGSEPGIRSLKLASKSSFDEGIKLYRNHDFKKAADIFRAICLENPADQPAQIYRDRCDYWTEHTINKNWDGVQILRNK